MCCPADFPGRAADLAHVAGDSTCGVFRRSSVERGFNLRDLHWLLDAWTAEAALQILGPEQDLQQARAVGDGQLCVAEADDHRATRTFLQKFARGQRLRRFHGTRANQRIEHFQALVTIVNKMSEAVILRLQNYVREIRAAVLPALRLAR